MARQAGNRLPRYAGLDRNRSSGRLRNIARVTAFDVRENAAAVSHEVAADRAHWRIVQYYDSIAMAH
jgi:hypothetical protein